MEKHFWLERWQRGEIGFHLPRPHPKLQRYWSVVAGDSQAPVLVPLCGKSLDMAWLSEKGHGVCGVELSEQALESFIDQAGLSLDREGDTFVGRGWELVCGDWFSFSAQLPFSLFYDRAALIALPPAMRRRYVAHLLSQLASGAQGLLITLEYEQSEMDGPPFSVLADEVQAHFGRRGRVLELDRADILAHEPHFRERGLSGLEEVVWHIDLS